MNKGALRRWKKRSETEEPTARPHEESGFRRGAGAGLAEEWEDLAARMDEYSEFEGGPIPVDRLIR